MLLNVPSCCFWKNGISGLGWPNLKNAEMPFFDIKMLFYYIIRFSWMLSEKKHLGLKLGYAFELSELLFKKKKPASQDAGWSHCKFIMSNNSHDPTVFLQFLQLWLENVLPQRLPILKKKYHLQARYAAMLSSRRYIGVSNCHLRWLTH